MYKLCINVITCIKCGTLYFLPEERMNTGVYLFVFFSMGGSYQHSGPRIPEECSFERTLKVIVPFLIDQKMGHLNSLIKFSR